MWRNVERIEWSGLRVEQSGVIQSIGRVDYGD